MTPVVLLYDGTVEHLPKSGIHESEPKVSWGWQECVETKPDIWDSESENPSPE